MHEKAGLDKAMNNRAGRHSLPVSHHLADKLHSRLMLPTLLTLAPRNFYRKVAGALTALSFSPVSFNQSNGPTGKFVKFRFGNLVVCLNRLTFVIKTFGNQRRK